MVRHAVRVRVCAIGTHRTRGIDAAVVGLLAALVSIIGAGRPSLWVDEAATLSAATRPLGELRALLADTTAGHGAVASGPRGVWALWSTGTDPSGVDAYRSVVGYLMASD